jgi:hypothetical protein
MVSWNDVWKDLSKTSVPDVAAVSEALSAYERHACSEEDRNRLENVRFFLDALDETRIDFDGEDQLVFKTTLKRAKLCFAVHLRRRGSDAEMKRYLSAQHNISDQTLPELRPPEAAKAYADDALIDEYLAMLQTKFPNCNFKNAVQAKWLTTGQDAQIVRIFRPLKAKNSIAKRGSWLYRLCFFPCSSGAHWTLLVIDFELGTVTTYNSLCSGCQTDAGVFHAIVAQLRWLEKEHRIKATKWQNATAEAPQQANGVDCGYFVMEMAKALATAAAKERATRHDFQRALKRAFPQFKVDGKMVFDFRRIEDRAVRAEAERAVDDAMYETRYRCVFELFTGALVPTDAVEKENETELVPITVLPGTRDGIVVRRTTLRVKTAQGPKRLPVYGLFTTKTIPRGGFVCFYQGAVHGLRRGPYTVKTERGWATPDLESDGSIDPSRFPGAMVNEPLNGIDGEEAHANCCFKSWTKMNDVCPIALRKKDDSWTNVLAVHATREIRVRDACAPQELFLMYGPDYNRRHYPLWARQNLGAASDIKDKDIFTAGEVPAQYLHRHLLLVPTDAFLVARTPEVEREIDEQDV